jgi:hypothetical protein
MRYEINKRINKPIEFYGLKAQYIGYLAGGLVFLLVLFVLLYLFHLPVYACLAAVLGLGGLLFQQLFKMSHKYGQYGLKKKGARRYLPRYLKFRSRHLFTRLKRSL